MRSVGQNKGKENTSECNYKEDRQDILRETSLLGGTLEGN